MTNLSKRHLISIREIVENLSIAVEQKSMLDVWTEKQRDNLLRFLRSELDK